MKSQSRNCKLSQDRTPTERERIITALIHDDDTVKATVGELMAQCG